MRELSETLLAEQQLAPIALGRIKVEVKNKRGSVRILAFERLYEGAEQDHRHGVAMPGDGSLIRIRLAGDPLYIYRQRVTDPDENSDYTQWTQIEQCHYSRPAVCASGANVLIFWVGTDPYPIRYIESTDNGATWTEPATLTSPANCPYWLAAAMKPNGDVCLIYWEWDVVKALKRTSGSWGSPATWTNDVNQCSSLAIVYHDDWNILVTGRDVDDNRSVWTCVYGDGNQASVGTWTALQDIMVMGTDTSYDYRAGSIDYLDEFRPFWCEWRNSPPETYHIYWTYSLPDKDYIDNLWREPIPFNYDSYYGLAICHSATHAWLSSPNGVWRASRDETIWDITSKVVEIKQWFAPQRYQSRLNVVVDNTAGLYNSFNKLGYEAIVYLGYKTAIGDEYSATPSCWITGWKFASPPWFPLLMIYPAGVLGTLHIEAETAWDILEGHKARRLFEWTAGQKSVKQLLEFVLARAGFELVEISSSSAINNFKPEFKILEGYTLRWAVKKLLSYVDDIVFQRDDKFYLKQPQDDDSVDYTYDSAFGNAHIVYRGQYGLHKWHPNRAQVWGTNLMVERFAWDQVDAIYDDLSRVEKPTYPDTTRATERAELELRKGEVWTGAGGWCQVPTNCGQELFDVIQITDRTAGVYNTKRRVLGIHTTYKKKGWQYIQKLSLGMP